VSREAAEIMNKQKEIESQEALIREIAEEKMKLDMKEQAARVKISTLRREITDLARQQQQREETERRHQQQLQAQKHQQSQQQQQQQQQQQPPVSHQQASGGQSSGSTNYMPIASQYSADPRSVVNNLISSVRPAPSVYQPPSSNYQSSGQTVSFVKLSLRYNIVSSAASELKSGIFSEFIPHSCNHFPLMSDLIPNTDPRNTSKFQFVLPSKANSEKILLRLCSFDRSKSLQADYITCRLNILINGSMAFGVINGQVRWQCV
jgi:hypothetical protein